MDATVNTNIKKKQKHPDRISLPPSALAKLGRWLDLLQNKSAGIRVTRSDLVTWLIETHAETLSSTEVADLEQQFFDNIKYAKWAVKAIMEAKSRGEVLTLKLVTKESNPSSPRKREGKKSKSNTAVTTPQSSSDQSGQSFETDSQNGEPWPSGS